MYYIINVRKSNQYLIDGLKSRKHKVDKKDTCDVKYNLKFNLISFSERQYDSFGNGC